MVSVRVTTNTACEHHSIHWWIQAWADHVATHTDRK